MRVIEDVEGLRKELDAARAAGLRVGLVPTMGALHEGHLSLVRRAVDECDVVAVTVFVNPLQFVPSEDLDRYPRDLDRDTRLAEASGASVVFAPPESEMYPCGHATTVTVAGLAGGLEGAARPDHFAGVATVVAKLLAIAGPCRAYFGEKDYQQLLVVRRLCADLSLPVEVVACPTVREADGLACSSRNAYLSGPERPAAGVLHRALVAAAAAASTGERDGAQLRALMAEMVGAEPLATLDYAEVADPGTLAGLDQVEGEARLLIAAWVGRTRLIDNLSVPVPGGA